MPLPTYEQCQDALRVIAQEKSEWAGLPMLVDDCDLILEPRFPYRLHVDRGSSVNESAPDIEIVNTWFNERYRCTVRILRENGRVRHGIYLDNAASKVIATLGASRAWRYESEFKAESKLLALVGSWPFRCYKLTGMFLESSKRSGVTYLFRKLRPTLALKAVGDEMRVLAALCLHPIGYYSGSWAGAMTPTDDVIAHLVLMRGDEHHFWKQANQHPAHVPSSGL